MKLEGELCPFCGIMVYGDPYTVKNHVARQHSKRLKEFIAYFNVMVRRWFRR